MQLITRAFEQLTVLELFYIYKLRSLVFVVEQNCAYQDPDDKDQKAYHVLLIKNEELAGYARLIPPGLSYPEPSIGRVVISPSYRGQRLGQTLMNYSLKQSEQLFGNGAIVISAQMYLLKFYTGLGFMSEGQEYLEDNIPHIRMRKRTRELI